MEKIKKPVYVTQPFLPPLEELQGYLRKIWDCKWVTNNGQFHQELEQALCAYLGVKFISLFSNGTLALIIALRALEITGEAITTPYSFVATTHALWWNNITPVFSDIEPTAFTLDCDKIESAITPETTAIIPVHVYGNPCKIKKIQEVADKYGLKVIYDAAHAFGVNWNGQSILNFGDLSVLSFHATKVYSTFEGGAIICPDEAVKKRIDLLKNFGFYGETTVLTPGINAKMNEFQAALGLLQLKYIDEAIQKRKNIAEIYRKHLRNTNGISVPEDLPGLRHCYAYFPILLDEQKYGKSRDEVYDELKKYNIFTRRYFYPLISQFPPYKDLESAQPGKMPVAERITKEVLCLPIYPDLETETAEKIVSVIK